MFFFFFFFLFLLFQRDSVVVGSLDGARTATHEARSRSAVQYKSSIDDVIGHHKVIVSTHTNVSTKNLKTLKMQLSSMEKLLVELEESTKKGGNDGAVIDGLRGYHHTPLTVEEERSTGYGRWRTVRMTNSVAHAFRTTSLASPHDPPPASSATLGVPQQQHKPPSAELDTKEEQEDVVVEMNKLHSLIRWNKKPKQMRELLLQKPTLVDFHDPRNGNTAIHIAAQNGHLDVVTLLIESGADLNAKNSKGNTALHVRYFLMNFHF